MPERVANDATRLVKCPSSGLMLGALSRWLALGVSTLLGLIVTPVIIRALGKEGYGLWGLAASFVGFYGLFDFGLSSAISRFIGAAIGAGDLAELNRVGSTGKVLLTGAAGLLFICAMSLTASAASFLNIPSGYLVAFRWLVVCSTLAVCISMITSVYSGALIASEDFVMVSVIQTGTAIVRSLSSLGVVLAGAGVVGLAAVNLTMTALSQWVVYLRCRKRLPNLRCSYPAFRMTTARSLIGFGAAAFVVAVAAVLRSKLDVAMVTRFGGLEEAGLYGVGLAVFGYFWSASIAVAGTTSPRLNMLSGAGDSSALQAFFLRASRLNAACVGFIGGLLVALASSLVRLWVGPGYESSALIVRILTAGYLLDLATNPGIGSLYATAKHRYFAMQTSVEAIASFALAMWLGSRLGMAGVALGIVLPITAVKLTLQPWYVARNLRISGRAYWWRCVVAPLCCSAGSVIGFAAVELLRVRNWYVHVCLSGAVTMGLGLALQLGFVLSAEDRAYLRHVLDRGFWVAVRVLNGGRDIRRTESEAVNAG